MLLLDVVVVEALDGLREVFYYDIVIHVAAFAEAFFHVYENREGVLLRRAASAVD